MLREDFTERSHRHLESLGYLLRSAVADPLAVYSVDRSRG